MTHYAFVHLEFGARHRESSMALLAKFRALLAKPGNRITPIIVDNGRLEGEESYRGHGFEAVRVVPGDNSNREFSGWDAGVAALLSGAEEPDVWVFTNDTAARHHGWSDARAARFCEEAEWLSGHPAPWMLGEVTDYIGSSPTPLGPQIQHVSTYAFVINRALRQGLGTLSPGNALLDSFVHDSYEPARKLFKDNVDPGYAKGCLTWLVAEEGEAEERARKYKWAFAWHNAKPLNAETFEDLRMKVRCVLSEGALTLRARHLGAEIRSPYDACNARMRIRRTAQFILHKFSERRILRRLQKA